MEYRERVINGGLYSVFHALILDDEDRAEIRNHADCENVEIELSSLEFLSIFTVIRNLIITGGIPTAEGMEALYAHAELEQLVLDYEETDSDEEGIDLFRFPNLKYVLSRSNLNIRRFAPERFPGVQMEVLNYYRAGKPVKAKYSAGYDLYKKASFWFVSLETYEAVGVQLGDLLFPVEKEFTDRHFGERFSEKLDRLAVIPICMPTEILKERRYISWKNRYADIRLYIPYQEFLYGDQAERIRLCKQNIQDAVEYVKKKDKSFEAERFLAAVWAAFDTVYPQ